MRLEGGFVDSYAEYRLVDCSVMQGLSSMPVLPGDRIHVNVIFRTVHVLDAMLDASSSPLF
jgi:hypothetical protein